MAEGNSEPESKPDVQYVLAGQPTGWSAMAKAVREFDEDKVKDCKEDIDTLLVFAGLFSAVLSAFLIASLPSLQPDPNDMVLAVLDRIAAQTSHYTFEGGSLNTTAGPFPVPVPFEPSADNVRVNVLWFASLLLSLTTASFGMLVKQWLREFLAVDVPSPQARLRIRHLRNPSIKAWKVFEIAAALPLLLQLSLGLFFVGLCYFTRSVHSSVGYTTLPLVVGWAICFFTATFLPLFFPRCPYKTTLLKTLVSHLCQSLPGMMIKIAARIRWPAMYSQSFRDSLRQHARTLLHRIAFNFSCGNEMNAVKTASRDMEILVAVDAIQSDDELLRSAIVGSIKGLHPEMRDVIHFMYIILNHRLQWEYPKDAASPWKFPDIYLQGLTAEARAALADILDLIGTRRQKAVAYEGQHELLLVASMSVALVSAKPSKNVIGLMEALLSSDNVQDRCRDIQSSLNDWDWLCEALYSQAHVMDLDLDIYLKCFAGIMDALRTANPESSIPDFMPPLSVLSWTKEQVLALPWLEPFRSRWGNSDGARWCTRDHRVALLFKATWLAMKKSRETQRDVSVHTYTSILTALCIPRCYGCLCDDQTAGRELRQVFTEARLNGRSASILLDALLATAVDDPLNVSRESWCRAFENSQGINLEHTIDKSEVDHLLIAVREKLVALKETTEILPTLHLTFICINLADLNNMPEPQCKEWREIFKSLATQLEACPRSDISSQKTDAYAATCLSFIHRSECGFWLRPDRFGKCDKERHHSEYFAERKKDSPWPVELLQALGHHANDTIAPESGDWFD